MTGVFVRFTIRPSAANIIIYRYARRVVMMPCTNMYVCRVPAGNKRVCMFTVMCYIDIRTGIIIIDIIRCIDYDDGGS